MTCSSSVRSPSHCCASSSPCWRKSRRNSIHDGPVRRNPAAAYSMTGRIFVNHDYVDPAFAQREYHSDAYAYGPGTGWDEGQADDVHSGVPLTAPAGGWDPVEE